LQNRSGKDALYLEVGSRCPQEDEVTYSDIDLKIKRGAGYTRKNGQPY
jgi:uncharacterized cupin superfamily protein